MTGLVFVIATVVIAPKFPDDTGGRSQNKRSLVTAPFLNLKRAHLSEAPPVAASRCLRFSAKDLFT